MVVALVCAVLSLHTAAALLLAAAGVHRTMLLGFAGVAYTLGMRHGFDADHIVAIDGTSRQLIARGRNANGVGFFFSLGHSTVVLLLAVWVARATQAAGRELPFLRVIGGSVGLATSSAFMVLVAALNVMVFRDALHATRDDGLRSTSSATTPFGGGLMTRIFGRVLRMISRAPQMYVVGFLFGLGFDTASEIALLAIAATAGAHALPISAVLVLPLSFAAGMAFVDTAEGLFMVRAYGWAQRQPSRRARYNLVITGFTAVAAVTIGVVELAAASGVRASLDPTMLGASIAGAFPLLWIASAINARMRRVRAAPVESDP
jgi:high-affinity nickel-transport protein